MTYPHPSDRAAATRFTADFLARVPDAPGSLRPLLEALGGNSPFLADLALREPATLLAIDANGPDAVCDAALGALPQLVRALDRPKIAAGLRQAKRTVALAASVADIGGAWDLESLTGALSDLAEGALRVASAHLLRTAHARGDLRLPHPAAPERGSGFSVLAMGKLGARELNFSSDVDLILLYDPAVYPDQADTIGHVFTRLARDLVGLMEARDAGGYVFRVDLRLRPDPASTPPCVALPAALAYYESLGQTWERAALIKARPVAGDIALGRRFLDAVRPFIWRRHLDFAAIADIHAMKHRMDAHKGTRLGRDGPLAGRLLGHDLKLGEGGIREVEFCAQTLQLVWGGRTPSLRVPATLKALQAEQREGHLPPDAVRDLETAYRFLRRTEHRLQMVADRQTHTLPTTPQALEQFAVFMGFHDAEAFAAAALPHLTAVLEVFTGLFAALPAPPDQPRAPTPEPLRPPQPGPPIPPAWLEGRPRALRTERSRALLRDLLPAIEAAIGRQPDPNAAMSRLDEFFHRLPAGVQLLSLLQHNPALLERLADVLGAAPWLADHLATVPASLEGLAAPQPIDPDPAASLSARLQDAAGLEDALAIATRMVRAEEFSIAVAELFGRIGVDEAAHRRTALADAVMSEFLARSQSDHAARYGKIPGGSMVVVALGKAGSGELMAGSDLDLMLIYDHAPDAESTGAKRLPASQYFARAAQNFVAALTVPTRHGPLYEVDMRLRPSGRMGPVAVSLASFTQYHRESAWTWERLALTRARMVAGPAALRRRVATAIATALRGADPARIRTDTADMRARLQRDKPPRNVWDIKNRIGGLMELELLVQALLLIHAARPGVVSPNTQEAIANLARINAIPPSDATLLADADRFWRTIQGICRMSLGRQIPPDLPPPTIEKLLHATGAGPNEAALRAAAAATATKIRAAFVRHVGDIDTP